MNHQGDLTSFFERSNSLYYIRLNPDGFYTHANPLYYIIFRYLKTEIHQQNFINRFTGDSRLNLHDTLYKVREGQQSTIGLELLMPDKREFWTRWELSPPYTSAGNFIGFIGIGNDISER